ncbi:hypothetical protein HS041_29280 [Planomonospora sp. ID67723]|uniref:hypothetical protein n=1 Tax=Planomonospora sp. ID67723 TaxID=2738134 RepID=UPI0018C384E8|nr:hypothetical protein [Planomonospora sp. ID67723]MBG0831814.1 hypothetical protein [Planomonospora sp. ID67723]
MISAHPTGRDVLHANPVIVSGHSTGVFLRLVTFTDNGDIVTRAAPDDESFDRSSFEQEQAPHAVLSALSSGGGGGWFVAVFPEAVTGRAPKLVIPDSATLGATDVHSSIRANYNRIVGRETPTHEYATIATWSGAD